VLIADTGPNVAAADQADRDHTRCLDLLTCVAELVDTDAYLPLGGTDASVITLAERHGETRVASLDHRHFAAVRPAHIDGFEPLP